MYTPRVLGVSCMLGNQVCKRAHSDGFPHEFARTLLRAALLREPCAWVLRLRVAVALVLVGVLCSLDVILIINGGNN